MSRRRFAILRPMVFGTRAIKLLKSLTDFIRNVAGDARIPSRDKKIVLALLALIISPFDLIPDWIPVIGLLDDLVLAAIVLDYFFNVLDDEILLSHWPWDMRAFTRMRKAARLVALLTPGWVRAKIWKFEASPYRPLPKA